MVLLEGSLQAQQLRRGEGRPDAFGLPGEGAVEQQAVLGHVVTCGTGIRSVAPTAPRGTMRRILTHRVNNQLEQLHNFIMEGNNGATEIPLL